MIDYTKYAAPVPAPALHYKDFKTQKNGPVYPKVLQACILKNGRGG